MTGLLLCLIMIAAEPGQDEDAPEGPKPVVALTLETMGRGDHPRVVLYEDGQLVFVKRDWTSDIRKPGERLIYHHVKLDQAQVEAFVKRVAEGMADAEPRYSVVLHTDAPISRLYLRQDDQQRVTSIYGLGNPKWATPSHRTTTGRSMKRIDVVPQELLLLHEWLWELDYEESTEWTARSRLPGEHVWKTAHANRNRASPSEQLVYAEDGLLRRHGEQDPAHGLIVDRHPNGEVEREMTLEGGKIVGEFREYHLNGQLQVSKQFEDGKEDGPYAEYDQRGNRLKVGQFVNGLARGAWIEFDARGTTRREYEMLDGQLHGHERIYNGRGQLIKENWYEDGEFVRSQVHKPD